MIFVGLELVAPSNSFDHAIDPPASASPLSVHQPSALGAFKFSFLIDGNRMQSSPMLIKSGKHGRTKVLVSESQLSDDEPIDETVRCNDSEKLKSTKHKKKRRSEL